MLVQVKAESLIRCCVLEDDMILCFGNEKNERSFCTIPLTSGRFQDSCMIHVEYIICDFQNESSDTFRSNFSKKN